MRSCSRRNTIVRSLRLHKCYATEIKTQIANNWSRSTFFQNSKPNHVNRLLAIRFTTNSSLSREHLVKKPSTVQLEGKDTGNYEIFDYSPPTTGILSYLPAKVVPYAELIRLNKPAGALYLLYPCLWSTLLASVMATPVPEPSSVLWTGLLFTSGAFIMRSAGCTMNDFWDRKFDARVSRTRHRPIARGAITPRQAMVFATGQCLLGFGILVQFPVETILLGVPSLSLAVLYALAKRVTNYPQAVLGLAFSWGAILGFPAMGVGLLNGGPALTAALCLYASNVAWTILYDIIYAHQDLRDDIKAGVKGIVVRHPEITKPIMAGLAVTQMGLLSAAGYAAGVGPLFCIWSVMGAGTANGWMIWKANLRNEKECWSWFVWNSWAVGAVAVGGGLTGEYLLHYLSNDVERSHEVHND